MVAAALAAEVAAVGGDGPLRGVSSMAAGADQIFALAVLAAGGDLVAIVPSRRYDDAFDDPRPYRALLSLAASVDVLDYEVPGETAYMAAGREVVDRCDVLLAVWDGQPAAGEGGTADVVEYARSRDRPVRVVWPDGSARR